MCGKDAAAVRIEFKLLHLDARIPSKKRNTDAAYDVYTIEGATIEWDDVITLRTGIIVACPPGYYITVEGRSGLGKCGIVPFRGIIDSTYCGELMITLINMSKNLYVINKHDRIAQIMLHKQYDMEYQEVEEFGPDYNQRGIAGFASSGR